jgi:hypothetical protein
MTPEENARGQIDALLMASGWVVQAKAHQLFGDKLPRLLDELNTVLAA